MDEWTVAVCILAVVTLAASGYTFWTLRQTPPPRLPESPIRPEGKPVNVRALVGSLSPLARQALESAACHAHEHSHAAVENELFLKMLVENPHSDVAVLLGHSDVDLCQLGADLNGYLATLTSNRESIPPLSNQLVRLLYQARNDARERFEAEEVRSGYILFTWLRDPSFGATTISPVLGPLEVATIEHSIRVALDETSEETG